MITLWIILLCGLLFLSAFFSSSETALFSLSPMKVKAYQRDSDPRKQSVAKLLKHPKDLLVTLLMINIAVNILVQNVVSSIFGDFSTWALNVGLPLALTLIFGDVIPKSIGLANNATYSYRAAPLLEVLQRWLFPIRKVLVGVTSTISRILFFFLKKEPEISIDELQHALKTSRTSGLLSHEEAELVYGYLSLEESSVKSLMRPREEILFFDTSEPLSKLIHLFTDQECTRVPVCEKELDRVLGIFTSNLFFLHREQIQEPKDLFPLLQKPFFVPETTPAKTLLHQMYAKQEPIALVVDEYGSISGLISLEDLIEVVVGQIADRRDEKSHYSLSGEDVMIASGKLELVEFEKLFDVALTSENNQVTLGGWLTEQLGDIPKSGVKYVAHDLLFHVLSADQKRVRRIYIRRLKTRKRL